MAQHPWNGPAPKWILERQVKGALGWETNSIVKNDLILFQAFTEKSLDRAPLSAFSPRLLKSLVHHDKEFASLLEVVSVDYWSKRTIEVSYIDKDGVSQQVSDSGFSIDLHLPPGAYNVQITFRAKNGANAFAVDREQSGLPYILDRDGQKVREKFEYKKCPGHICFEMAGTAFTTHVVSVSEMGRKQENALEETGNDVDIQEPNLRYNMWTDETTAEDGWIYSTGIDRIREDRPGGRRVDRVGDRFRQRWWQLGRPDEAKLQVNVQAASASNAPAGGQTLDAMNAVKEILSIIVRRNGKSCLAVFDPVALARRTKTLATDYEALCARLPEWNNAEVLGDLCVAALYARAVYGFAARCGMLDTLHAGARMFTVQKALFDVAGDADAPSISEAFMDMMGLSPCDLVTAQWRIGQTLAHAPAYAVVRDHEMRWITVVVRGTTTWNEVFTDMAAVQVPFLGGVTHQGFEKATRLLLEELGSQLEQEAAAYPEYQLVFCGHSMGAAVAIMAAALLRSEAPWAAECRAYGIGTPAVFSRCIAERLAHEGAVFSAINDLDWAPRCSESSAHDLIERLNATGMVSSVKNLVGMMKAQSEKNENQESGYNTQAQEDATTEQLPPGVILQIRQRQAEMLPPQMLLADPSDYRRSMPILFSFESHLPINYVRGISRGFISGADAESCALAALHRIAEKSIQSVKLPKQPDAAKKLISAFLTGLRASSKRPSQESNSLPNEAAMSNKSSEEIEWE